MRKKKNNSIWLLIAVAIVLVIVFMPDFNNAEFQMADASMCTSAVSLMNADGKAISGSIIPITPCCMYDKQITSCNGGYPYDGVVFIADLANTGNVDIDASIDIVLVTPIDKDADAELARRVFMSFEEEAYIMKSMFIKGGISYDLETSGLYKGSGVDQLVPAGGQAMWFTLISRTGSPNGGLVSGNVIIDYQVCATDPAGRFKKTCADQEPFLLTVDENENIYVTRWTGAV